MLDRILGRREAEKQMRAANRLPPGQSLTEKFPVLHYGETPRTYTPKWDFRIFGLVEEERRWNWDEFRQLPQTEVTLDIHCVTRWSKFNTRWKGISMRTLIDEGLLKLKPGAAYVLQHAAGGYTTNLPLEITLQKNFLLATHFKGEPLTPDHGAPLREAGGEASPC